MRGVIYEGIHDIQVKELPIPRAGEHDIVIQVMRNGICGSDLHAYNLGGDEIGILKGAAIGHEFVGVVTEVGTAVTDIVTGDHVFVNPSLAKGSTSQLAMAGGLSQYNLIQDARLNWNVFKLPKSLSFDRAVVTEPYAVGIHGKNLLHPQAGQNFVVFGAGPVGLASASGLLEQNIPDVVVIDIDDQRLAFAKKLGAHVINPKSEDLHTALIKRFGTGHGLMDNDRVNVDAYIDCVGIPEYMTDFINWGKFGAKFVVVALGASPVTYKPQFLAMNELSFIGSAIYTATDIKEAIQNISKPSNYFPEIVSAHYPLEKAQEAFERANTDKEAVKVIIDVND